jgi:hypothetical protein
MQKPINHRGTETQRKSKTGKPEILSALPAFLCASVISRELLKTHKKPINHRGAETQGKSKTGKPEILSTLPAFLCASVSLCLCG